METAPRPRIIWIIGGVCIASGILGLFGLFVLPLWKEWQLPARPLASFHLWGAVPGLLALMVGVRFLKRPNVVRLGDVVLFFTLAAAVVLLAAIFAVTPASGWSFMAVTLVVAPLNIWANLALASRMNLPKPPAWSKFYHLNPWRMASGGWLMLLGVEVWGLLLACCSPYTSGRAASDPSDSFFMVNELLNLARMLMPYFGAWLFHRLAFRWLSAKARAYDECHLSAAPLDA